MRGQILQSAGAIEMSAIGVGHLVGDGSGSEETLQNRGDIDGLRRHPVDRLDHEPTERARYAGGVEIELRPDEAQRGGQNGAARDARDAVELGELAELIQSPK